MRELGSEGGKARRRGRGAEGSVRARERGGREWEREGEEEEPKRE